nr:MAG TPA: hypothetical protein [Caudoviricetes sp.]
MKSYSLFPLLLVFPFWYSLERKTAVFRSVNIKLLSCFSDYHSQ